MTVIALTGPSPAVDTVRRRLDRSRLEFELTDDPSEADLTVTGDEAPEPNYLTVAAWQTPDVFYVTDESVDYVVSALTEAQLAGAFGVRVRRPVQDNPRRPQRRRFRRTPSPLEHFDPVDYDWDTDETTEAAVFDGEVTVVAGGESFPARLRARGRVDGNDGNYHWTGLLYGDRARELKEDGKSRATVAYGDGEAVPARLAEITQWGVVRMTGVGAPPWVAAEDAALTGG